MVRNVQRTIRLIRDGEKGEEGVGGGGGVFVALPGISNKHAA